MTGRNETEIVVAATAGNRTAFEQLVVRYQNLITSLAYSRTGDLQRSEDIAQQAFLTAWEKRTELQDPSRFGGWLRSITRNITLNSNRKSKRLDRSAASLETENEPTTDTSPADSLAASEQQQLLWATLNNIPEQYREPLVLFYREDKSVAQVAELLGLSVDVTKQRLSRGRAMLKSEVESFVEDLLGATKPCGKFSSAIMMALPGAATSVGGKAVVQGAAAAGAKPLFTKLAAAFSGPMLGMLAGVAGTLEGVAGAYYGTKKLAEHATSNDERDLLWSFFRRIVVLTLGFVLGVILFSKSGQIFNPLRGYVFVGGLLTYIGVLRWTIQRFNTRQKQLRSIHGTLFHAGGEQKAIPVNEIRWAMIGSTVGCWAWLIVLSATESKWVVCVVATAIMLGIIGVKWVSAAEKVTLPEQLQWQAMNVLTNTMLAVVVLMVGGYLFGLRYEKMPNWGMAVFMVAIGWSVAASIWYSAMKADKQAELP